MHPMNRFFAAEVIAACTTIYFAYIQFSYVATNCVGFNFFGIMLLVIGITFVILGIIGFTIAALESKEVLLKVKTLCCSMPLVLVVFMLGIFVVAVSIQGGGKAVPGRSYKKYEVESYSKWMQNKVHANWDKYYKLVVVENKEFVCARYDYESDNEIRADPAFESGCCEPPRGCKFCSFNLTTSQGSPKLENHNYCDDDCHRWSNDPNTLCFDCQSCKGKF